MFNQLFRGYVSCIKEIFCIKNDREYIELKSNIFIIFSILGFIGLLRNFLEVLLGINIHPKWYVLDRDISFTMFFFPIYLCFFGACAVHMASRLLKQNISYKKLFSYIFYLQVIHLFIPFIDYIGLKYKVPWYFYLSRPYISSYFTNGLVMTSGIIVVWLITIYMNYKILVYYFKINILNTLMILIICFNLLYWPIYHFWPSFNTLFNLIFHLPNNHLYGFYWGYGCFFMFSFFIGLLYYRVNIEHLNRK